MILICRVEVRKSELDGDIKTDHNRDRPRWLGRRDLQSRNYALCQ